MAPSGNTKDASAGIQLDSTTQGLALPRMTTTQRDAISTPLAGLHIYNTTTSEANFYNGTAWVKSSSLEIETVIAEEYIGTRGLATHLGSPSYHGGVGHELTTTTFNNHLIGSNNGYIYNLGDVGTTITDTSGNAAHFTAASTLTAGTGITGVTAAGSLFTAGKDVSYSTSTHFKASASFSAGFWVSADDYSATQQVLLFQGASTSSDMGYTVYLESDAVIFAMSTSGTAWDEMITETLTENIAANDWNHISVKYDTTAGTYGTMYVYVNDQLLASRVLAAAAFSVSTNDTDLGHLAGTLDFEGQLDEFFFVKYAMEDHEVSKTFSIKFAHTQSSDVYHKDMYVKATLASGQISRLDGTILENSTDTTDVYMDLEQAGEASAKVQMKLR